MRAIIFGAAGQDGYYMGKLLTSLQIEWVGVSRSGEFLKLSLSDRDGVTALIKEVQPEYIFHLAASSTTRHDVWQHNHETIATGTWYILEAVREVSPHTKVFISGSGLQFINKGLPIRETDPFDASSSYSVSRIHSVYTARYYRILGVRTFVGYFFNHDSPRRGENHVTKKIAEAVTRISRGSREILEIGDISVKKEWGFAGDIVDGIWTLVQQDRIAEAVIGTGEAHSIEEWLDLCFSSIGKDWKDHVREMDNFRAEYEILVSDPGTIRSLGWAPKVSFTELAKIMMPDI
jgi:GDPmannose 4,6-dehydratase